MKYGYTKKVNIEFNKAVDLVKEELAKEGFGVLTEIDVRKTLKAKLDVEFENYVILGACNPSFAYEALQVEREIGLLLPCNVIVYQKSEDVFVSAIVPSLSMGMVENKELANISLEVEEKLKRVIDAL